MDDTIVQWIHRVVTGLMDGVSDNFDCRRLQQLMPEPIHSLWRT
jgi:hypothetical protein